MKVTLMLLTLVLSAFGAANAGFMELRDYRSMKATANPQALNAHIEGLGTGIVLTGLFFEEESREPLFCMPADTTFDSETFIALIDREIDNPAEGPPYGDDAPMAMILIYALIDTFPCE